MKKNQFVLFSKSKVSKGEPIEFAISIYTKRHIEEIKNFTKKLRENCKDRNIKKHLFILEQRKNIINVPRLETVNAYLKKCCEEAGIPKYTMQNLRDTHMTKAFEFQLRKGLSPLELSVLTGHKKIDTTNNHYIETKIKDMLEIVHGTTIGNVDVKGNIMMNAHESIANMENTVSNGCGFCSLKSCKDYTNLACLMCDSFVATLDRIPYFEDEIIRLNHLLPKTEAPHEKENLD
ncbi:hypothetical protein NXY55_23475, partial [Aeromonas veronii]|nr:hypothetical protein [Aeromonas veronii]